MPDGTNIRPVTEALARRSRVSEFDAVGRYKIGRVYGLRSEIVHNGYSGKVSPRLPQYLRAVFVDLIGDVLNESFGEVERLLETSGFSLDEVLRGQ